MFVRLDHASARRPGGQPAHLRDLRGPSFMLQIETIGWNPIRPATQESTI